MQRTLSRTGAVAAAGTMPLQSDPAHLPFGFHCKNATRKKYHRVTGTTGDLTAYDIELRSHSSDTATTGCGEEVFASLCTEEAADEGGLVCMDSDGSYNVQVSSRAIR